MDAQTNTVLKINNLSYKYSDKSKFAVKDISFNFDAGKIYAILGQNGSGKSTLLKCMCSYINTYDGQICIKDKQDFVEVKKLNSSHRAQNIAFVPQTNYHNNLDVYENIMLGRKPYINFAPTKIDHEMTSRAIDKFNLNHLSFNSFSDLSGGEAQTVSIARAYAQNTPVLLMDEPSNNLDVKRQAEIFELIKQDTVDKNTCVICVLHDINQALKFADELIFMKDGEIKSNGSSEIITKEMLYEIYEIDAKILNDDGQKFIII